MAAVDYYLDPDLAASSPRYTAIAQRTGRAQGAKLQAWTITATLAAGDSNASIYRIFPSVPSTHIIIGLWMACDAIAGFTSAAFGTYLPLNSPTGSAGTVVNSTQFSSGITLANAVNSLTPGVALDCLWGSTGTNTPQTPYAAALPSASVFGVATLPLWVTAPEQLAALGTSQREPAFDICMTATTRGANGGNVAFLMHTLAPYG